MPDAPWRSRRLPIILFGRWDGCGWRGRSRREFGWPFVYFPSCEGGFYATFN